MDTLHGLQAETEAAFHLAFFVAELNGLNEAGEINDDEAHLLRVLTPIMKLTTGKQAVVVASEVLESFGGAGYIEDTGLPALLRDSQVLPIWEGTTNVLALDTLRALAVQSNGGENKLATVQSALTTWLASIRDPLLLDAAKRARAAVEHSARWLGSADDRGPSVLEAGARRLVMTLGRAVELALLVRHAQWSQDHEQDGRATTTARRFAYSGIDLIIDLEISDTF
jgi:hypothetical protein